MPNIVAQFVSSPSRTGVAPFTVNFTNTSTGPFSRCRWDFGGEGQSSSIHPTHIFQRDGVFQVGLTIYDEQSGSSTYSSTITVFSDDDYSTSSTTQQALFTTKRFSVGQLAVRKTVVDGSVLETEFPLSASTGGFSTQAGGNVLLSMVVSASTGSSLAQVQYRVASHPKLATYVGSGYTSYLGLFMKSGSTTASTACSGHQLFMYRITGASGANLYLDRPTPHLTGNTSLEFAAFAMFSSGGTTGNTMSPNSAFKALQCAPSIDSKESLNIKDMYQPNVRASGTYKYFHVDSGIGETKLFITPTFSGWNTVESWKPSTVRLVLPYVLWHNKGSAGVNLIDLPTIMVDKTTSLPYSNLIIENDETIVGRVFHTSKVIVIDDLELQAAVNYLSNRNYTLPAPLVSTTSVSDSTGGLQSGVTYFITYRCRDSLPYTGGVQYGTTEIQPLHCRYIQQLTPQTSGKKFRIQAPASVWFDTTTRTVSNSTGFTLTAVDVLIASATTGSTLSSATWFYSGNIGAYANLNSGIDVAFNTGTSMPQASFSALSIVGNTNLKFGDDPLLLGYFSATAQSTIYKMAATLVAKNNEFNQTQNSTYDNSVNESVYISEAALYNENNELLMTGKLNNPIEKNDKKFVTIKMELDL